MLLQVAFDDPCFIQWIPAANPVHSHANVWVLETCPSEVNKPRQLLSVKEKVALIVITTRKRERRVDRCYNRKKCVHCLNKYRLIEPGTITHNNLLQFREQRLTRKFLCNCLLAKHCCQLI